MLEADTHKALDLGLFRFALQRGEYIGVGAFVKLQCDMRCSRFIISFFSRFFSLDYIHTLSGIGAVARPAALIFKRLLQVIEHFFHFGGSLFRVRFVRDFPQGIQYEADEGFKLAICLSHVLSSFPLGMALL